jgi:hypothetical protein
MAHTLEDLLAMVRDELVIRAVSHVLQRSERQEDILKLVGTFVDVGILPQLENRNNQILYGRRGTGKTHVLRVLGSRIVADPTNTVVYLDARVLGSTAQFSDSDLPLRHRCLALFRDVLGEIHSALLEHVVNYPPREADVALTACDTLASSIVDPVETYQREQVTAADTVEAGTKTDLGAELGRTDVALKIGHDETTRSEASRTTTVRVQTDDKVVFPSLHQALAKTRTRRKPLSIFFSTNGPLSRLMSNHSWPNF